MKPHREIAIAAPIETSVIALLTEIRDELRGLRADLHAARQRPSRAGLLAAIAAAVGDRIFTAREVIEHAAIHPPLAAALTRAGITGNTSARVLGKYFEGIEARPVDSIRLVRVGLDRHHVMWRCECQK